MKKWGLLKEEKGRYRDNQTWDKAAEECVDLNENETQKLSEDSKYKESEDYGEDESADKREEDSLEHHLDSIEHHLHALRRDMHFDEEHIDEGHVHSADCEHADELSEGDDGEEKEKAPEPGVKVTKPEHHSATTTKLHPVKVKKEGMSRKISVREAKELTSRIIERIKAESK